ncbi:MAG: hypothetical protein N2B06_14635 [Clostridium sp.]
MSHTKDDKYFKLLYIALGILIYLEFKGTLNVIKNMNVVNDILMWTIIAVPTIYYVIKKDVRKLVMFLVIPVIFTLIGLIFTYLDILNYI